MEKQKKRKKLDIRFCFTHLSRIGVNIKKISISQIESVDSVDKIVHKYKKWKKCIAMGIAGALLWGVLPLSSSASAASNFNYAVNDPFYKYQWALRNDGTMSYTDPDTYQSYTAVAGIDANVENAWNFLGNYRNSKKVVVAVIDTGVDYTHPDLTNKIWKNPGEIPGDGIDNDGNGFVDDVYGWNFYDNNNQVYSLDSSGKEDAGYYDDHGTHCAGSIIAEQNNGIGIAGVASGLNVEVMIVKALGGKDGIEKADGKTSSVLEAMRYAEQMGADICNLSVGGYTQDQEMSQFIEKSDMLFICACGNDSKNIDKYPVWPAALTYENVISVADVTPRGTLSPYSNYGVNSVTLGAPGTRIASTGVNGEYIYLSGTSMAAPIVSGIAAMLYAYHPDITADAAKQVLVNSVTKMSALNNKVYAGGMVNAYQALAHDFHLPQITIQQEKQKSANVLTVDVSTIGGAQVDKVLWAEGNQNYDFFQQGTVGNALTNNQLKVTKSGTYTVYAMNKNGMQNVKTVNCKIGSAPSISVTVKNGKKAANRIMKVKVTDSDKNLKAVYYVAGSHTKSEFSNREIGKKLKLNSSGKVNVTGKKGKKYTFYAEDKAGNTTVMKIICK